MMTTDKKPYSIQELLVKVSIQSEWILHICNLWVLLRKFVKYLVGQQFDLREFLAVKVLIYKHAVSLRISIYLHRVSTYSIQNLVIHFQYVYNYVFSLKDIFLE